MGKNNSEASLSDVDYDQISLSKLEDQKYEIYPQAKRIKLELKMNNVSKMEEFCERFPVLNKEILDQLELQKEQR